MLAYEHPTGSQWEAGLLAYDSPTESVGDKNVCPQASHWVSGRHEC